MTTNTEWPRPRWRRRRSLRSFRSFRRLEMLTLLLLRIVLLEAPLLLSLALLLTTHALELYIHQVVEPDLQARQSSKRFRDGSTCLETTGYRNTMQTPTVYPTTASGPALCPQQLPELISRSKADLLRGYILGSLSMDEDIAISHRTNVVGEQSWTLVVDEHPAVSLFLEELFNNPFLDALLKQLLGDDAAVVGFRVSVSPSTKSLEQESVPKLACEESGRITAATLTIPLHDSNVVTSSGELSPEVPIWPTSSGHLCIHSQPSARSLPYIDFGGNKT
ncbi:predicted protein [Phaeodactylum tricornutum CCAP 1055/1]|uniref:Uncharacterized protein n=1 Tax=Phaeodactylum tricornutum (strain CCAP 1055/1) TaxID=556484 RepID=B7FXE0_PHATC|nr:predicted protein [Phaeodactylum tricornutum CCAP 1055/1]EEC49362.1 predicted protein [Phaeodactylum tricornutum CCAP 1055/1]|eukprot:XP_002179539.1 predicted protein [Phaeodactylum tricornutum CCAP 1055/1]